MLKRLLQQGSVYAVAAVVAKVGGLILIAFYVNEDLLPKADLGVLGVIDAVKALGLLVAGAGLPVGLLRFASTSTLRADERDAVPVTALLIAIGTAVAMGIAVASLAPKIAAWSGFDGANPVEPIRWLAAYIVLRTVADVSITTLRHQEQSGRFVLASILEVGLLVIGVVFFLVVRGEGLVGILKGYVVSAGGLAFVLTPRLLATVSRRASMALVGPLLLFSLPLIASGLAGRFLNLGDRFLLMAFLGPTATAEYELAARFGGLVNTLVVQSFGLAFTVLGLKALDGQTDSSFHRRAFRHLAAFVGLAALGLGLVYSDLVRLLPTQDPSYAELDGVVVLIAGGFGFYGLYYVTVNVLYGAARTRAVAGAVGAAAVLNLVLNLILIPWLGIVGAALSTLVAYGALAYGTGILAEQSLAVGYSWRSVGIIAGAVATLWSVGQVADGWSVPARLSLSAALVLAYPAALVAAGVYGRADLNAARNLVARWRGREHDGSTPGASP